MASELYALERWVASKLTADLIGLEVYRDLALPTVARTPYVIWSWQDMGEDTRGGCRIDVRPTLLVRLVRQEWATPEEDALCQAAWDAIEGALEGVVSEVWETDWRITSWRRGMIAPYMEPLTTQDQALRNEGALYQLVMGGAP